MSLKDEDLTMIADNRLIAPDPEHPKCDECEQVFKYDGIQSVTVNLCSDCMLSVWNRAVDRFTGFIMDGESYTAISYDRNVIREVEDNV